MLLAGRDVLDRVVGVDVVVVERVDGIDDISVVGEVDGIVNGHLGARVSKKLTTEEPPTQEP